MHELEQLEELLDAHDERLDLEFKSWLDLSNGVHAADLAQAILALANHGGGWVVIGNKTSSDPKAAGSNRPANLSDYSQDRINGLVQKFAEPSFHCGVHQVAHRKTGAVFPVVQVPGGHKVPIRSRSGGPDGKHVKAHCYYIRRPGPSSEPPQTATEWDELIGRCIRNSRDDLLTKLRGILDNSLTQTPSSSTPAALHEWMARCDERFAALNREHLAQEQPNRYSRGFWSVGYELVGDVQTPSLSEMMTMLQKAEGHETGWPMWWAPERKGKRPYAVDDAVECWMAEEGEDAAHSDFWRASPTGRLFLLRGYQDDCSEKAPPQSFDPILPVWRVGEILLHAHRLGALLAPGCSVRFIFRWNGLKGRTLRSWTDRVRMMGDSDHYMSKAPAVTTELTTSAETIPAALPLLAEKALSPLYERFGFFKQGPRFYQREIERLLNRR